MLNYLNYGRLWRVYGRSVLRYGSVAKIVNALRTEIAYRRRQVDVRTHPYVLFIEPLYYCNLKCPLCPRERSPDARRGKDAGKLPLDLFDRILDEIGDSLFQCQIFGNGEPLLDWPRTRAIIERAHARRVYTLVSTNSTLFTPKVADEVVASKLDYLIFAIDGLSQASYERYRVGGSVEKALDGMRMVVEQKRRQNSRIGLEWQFLVNRFNAHEVDAARKMSEELGVYFRPSPMGGVSDDPEVSRYWLPDDRAEPVTASGRRKRTFPCYWLWRSLAINSNGQLGRCPGYSNIAELGSVQEQSIMSIYNGPSSQRSRQLFVKGDVPDGPFPWPCNTCSYFERERGGQSADAVMDRPGGRSVKLTVRALPDEAVASCSAG